MPVLAISPGQRVKAMRAVASSAAWATPALLVLIDVAPEAASVIERAVS